MSIVFAFGSLCGIGLADLQQDRDPRFNPYVWHYQETLEDLGKSEKSNVLSDTPVTPEFEEHGNSDGSFHVGIPPMQSPDLRTDPYRQHYQETLEDLGASVRSENLSDAPAIPEFEEHGNSDGTFHVGIPPMQSPDLRTDPYRQHYQETLEDLGASVKPENLSDAPAIPEFEEHGNSDGTFHVGIPMLSSEPRADAYLWHYQESLEDLGASAKSKNLSDVPVIPEFEEHGNSDGTFHVGIPPMQSSERRLSSAQYSRTAREMEAIDNGNLSWPFLVEFQSIPEMNAAIEHHLSASPGSLRRMSMPALGDVNVTKLVETKWLAPSQLEMSCHTDMPLPLCHRFLPGDFFGVTCVRYTDPSSNGEVTQLAGIACHQHLHKMCHLALDFVVRADVAEQVECLSTTIVV